MIRSISLLRQYLSITWRGGGERDVLAQQVYTRPRRVAVSGAISTLRSDEHNGLLTHPPSRTHHAQCVCVCIESATWYQDRQSL
jgi:hypothetical protein